MVPEMKIASMTGFARLAGASCLGPFAWEIKAVNARGLDIRLRVAALFDSIEPEARARIARRLTRGTVNATLTTQRATANPEVRVNQDLLQKLASAIAGIDLHGSIAPATLDGLLAVRGVVEVADAEETEDQRGAACVHVLASLDAALDDLVATRICEGKALGAILSTKLASIQALVAAADSCPARRPEAIRARLAQSIAILAGQTNFDQNRLYQEALLLAAKADVREELDRLMTHATAARELLAEGGAIGRRLDFLAQEFGREAGTLCAKSNDASLTNIGLELRAEIEQFREQIQNIE
jgi:uncharacterized protein (TIGR00255 family)